MKTTAQNKNIKDLPVDRSSLLMLEPLFKTIFFPDVLSATVVGH